MGLAMTNVFTFGWMLFVHLYVIEIRFIWLFVIWKSQSFALIFIPGLYICVSFPWTTLSQVCARIYEPV